MGKRYAERGLQGQKRSAQLVTSYGYSVGSWERFASPGRERAVERLHSGLRVGLPPPV